MSFPQISTTIVQSAMSASAFDPKLEKQKLSLFHRFPSEPLRFVQNPQIRLKPDSSNPERTQTNTRRDL